VIDLMTYKVVPLPKYATSDLASLAFSRRAGRKLL
jgi:hypothetical protein